MTHPTSDSTDRQAGGYEHDLREAENAMAAAGHPDIALGMRRHSEAQRNMMQGVMVPMFAELVERMLGPKIDGLRADVQAWASESAARLGKNEADIEAFRTRLDLFEAKVAQDIQARLAHIEHVLSERPVARAREHQAILDAITQSHADLNTNTDHDSD